MAVDLKSVRRRVETACRDCRRDPADVELLAVSKVHPVSAIREAYAQGQRAFGENYVVEMADKAEGLHDLSDVRFHFIGHLQRNKARRVVAVAHTVQTLDRLRLAEAISHLVTDLGRPNLDVYIQVNLGGETQKSGAAPEEVSSLCESVRSLPGLNLVGLMTIPPVADDPSEFFQQLALLARDNGLKGLSMGMSADLEQAIAAGATIVRVGTAIFGPRPPKMS